MSDGKEVRHIETREQAEMFILFLVHERERHKKDIDQVNADIYNLMFKWKIPIPCYPKNGIWWEV